MSNRVAIDLGASQIKVIYQLEGQQRPMGITLQPHVVEVNSSQADHCRNQHLTLSPSLGWVTLKKRAPKIMAVDELAEQEFTCPDYHQLKINAGEWRVMGTLGKIMAIEQLQTPEQGFKLQLKLVLPWGEFNKDDISLFSKKLKKSLSSFYFREQKIEISLENLKILPEGMGSYVLSDHHCGTTIIVMLGHRNTSYLIFKNKEFVDGRSLQLGFHTLVSDFCQKTSGQQANSLTTRTLWRSRQNLNQLRRISRTQSPELQEYEFNKLKAAFATSTEELWSKIKGWLLTELSAQDFEHLELTGGVSEFLKPQIKEDPIFQNLQFGLSSERYSDLLRERIKFRGVSRSEIDELALRFIDCYGVFQ